MTIVKKNRSNFHKHSFCIFKEVDIAALEELKLNYKSKSGSSYYFTEEGVFRLSNHWSRVANCRWRLEPNVKLKNRISNRTRLGFAKWTDFYLDNEYEKLYFITVDFEQLTADYFHKQSPNFQSKLVLRTASETMKTIKQIRILLNETSWAKHLKEINIDKLRKEIIEQIITTNVSFQEIRRHYLP